MGEKVDVITLNAGESFAGRAHAAWMVTAGANPREKGIHDAAFGPYGATVGLVSFEHTYAHMPEYGSRLAADYAERLVACADAMKGIADPRAFVATVAELIEAVHQVEALEDEMHRAYLAGQRRDTYGTVWETKDAATQKDRERRHEAAHKRLAAALANIGGAK